MSAALEDRRDHRSRDRLRRGRVVAYFYPRTGRPGVDPPPGWDQIPGARGCTPQSCSYRDHFHEFETLDAKVFGVSTQSTERQQEFAARASLPFALLSDPALLFAQRLRMPTFELDGCGYYRRTTLVLSEQRIQKVFYPVRSLLHMQQDILLI